jgi:hypothetical protein
VIDLVPDKDAMFGSISAPQASPSLEAADRSRA